MLFAVKSKITLNLTSTVFGLNPVASALGLNSSNIKGVLYVLNT